MYHFSRIISEDMGCMANLVRLHGLTSVRAVSSMRTNPTSTSKSIHSISKESHKSIRVPVLSSGQLSLIPPCSVSFHSTPGNYGKKRNSRRGKGGKQSVNIEDQFACVHCGSQSVECRQLNDEKFLVVCNECHRKYEVCEDPVAEENSYTDITPKEIKAFLDKYIIGQDIAKVVFSTAVYNHYKRVRHNATLNPPETQNQTHEVYESGRTYYPKDARNIGEEWKASKGGIHVHKDLSVTLDGILRQQFNMLTSQGYARARSVSKPKVKPPVDPRSTKENAVVIDKTNILLIGPTGSGKTMLAKTIVKQLNVPHVICDCTQFTAAGYVGSDVDSIITKLLQDAEGDVSRCEQGIVFLDEVDKIARVKHNHNKDVGGEEVQQGLLKIMEGTKLQVSDKKGKPSAESVAVDTTNILFVASGAFTGLEKIVQKRLSKNSLGFGQSPSDLEKDNFPQSTNLDLTDKELGHEQVDECFRLVEDQDLIMYGMIPEFVGRLPCVVPFHHLTEHMLIQVLTEPKNALLKQFQKLFHLDNVELELTAGACQTLARNTIRKRTGARGLRAELDKCLFPLMFEIPKSDIKKVIIDEDFILGKSAPVYIRDDPFCDIEQDSAVDSTDMELRKSDLHLTEKQPEVTSLQDLSRTKGSEEKTL
ncbi:ATP-dependent Clp protease ATP-binding subunit ClpX-like isoform X3 [Dreissena polymorpha]|nr:ATP-dependent Clp protease ATP-binding subunit ClpX-like isoform X3 [Dreissena polymorpha]